jgi:putative tetratricopeptide repeat-containing domain protein
VDKYEYKLKLEQLQNLMAAGDYATASEMADTINWKKVRSSNTLCMVSDIYEKTEKYDACREVLLQAYDHSPIGRNIVSKLAEVSIKAKRIDEAEEYYNEFLEIAPKDNMRYVLAYEISCLKDAPLTDRIAILEELKEHEYTEKWAYELAALYGQADMRDKCVETCDELILWFGEGEYVEKALDLKRLYQPLTPAQEEKYKQFREKKGMVEISIPAAPERKNVIHEMVKTPETTVTASKFNTSNLEEELAKSMKQIMEATKKETVVDTMENIKKIVGDIPYLNGEHEAEETFTFDKEKINEQVDERLKKEFDKLMAENAEESDKKDEPETEAKPEETLSEAIEEENAEEDTIEEKAASAQASIEEVLDEWEKTKHAAEIAIAAAEQKKLEISKEHALVEAGEIMERLKTLIPILSATPGEEIPVPEDTVAAALVPDESEKVEAKEDLEETAEVVEAEAESETEETKEAAETVETESQIEPETEKAADEETVVEAAEPSVEAADAELEDVEEEAPVEEKEDLSTTKEMPDLKAARAEKTAETEEEAEAEEEPKEEKRLSVVEPVPDEELEKVLAQATQMFVENANVEVPVTGTAPTGVSQNTGVLPEIQMPDDIEEDKKELTEEQKELFSYFLPVPGMEDQIRQVLLGAKTRIGNSVTSLAGNILIQGEEGSGKTVFATSLIKAIQKEIGNEDAKIGKISAESLNHKDFAALIPKIEGGYLIVDKAGQLTAETAAYMSQVMEQNTQGMVVILEDTRAGIRKVMNLDFGFTKKFTEKIDIPIFTIDELVDFGKSYAKEMECTIDEMGVLALYNRINNIQKLDRATTLAEVKDIVDEAIEKAEGSGIKKAFGSIFSKKYNENDYLILHEKDFE